jgi:hypothetical protein
MNWLLRIIGITQAISPEVKATIHKSIDDMEAAAQATKLPVDDIAVGVLKMLCLFVGLY